MIFKYLPLIYLNHNRHKIEYYINQYLFNTKISKLQFIPYQFNYFLYHYYKKIKTCIKN